MASIYKGALSCLVLDHGLMTTDAAVKFVPHSLLCLGQLTLWYGQHSELNDQSLSNLFSSVWMRRSWTFQETSLAKILTIRFRNGNVTLRRFRGMMDNYFTARLELDEGFEPQMPRIVNHRSSQVDGGAASHSHTRTSSFPADARLDLPCRCFGRNLNLA